jgi:hypothetical protein
VAHRNGLGRSPGDTLQKEYPAAGVKVFYEKLYLIASKVKPI